MQHTKLMTNPRLNSSNIHIFKDDEGAWVVRREGASRMSGRLLEERKALDFAKSLAVRSGGVITMHLENGEIKVMRKSPTLGRFLVSRITKRR